MIEQAAEKLVEFYHQGGSVMPWLVAQAALLWFALGYRTIVLRRGDRRPLQAIIEDAMRPGGQKRSPRGLVDTAVARGCALLGSGTAHIERRLDVALADLRDDASRFSVLVDAIVVIAPLSGLLGTVTGMIETFNSLVDMSLHSQSGGISAGVSEALLTTEMGLVVAIPGLLLGRVLGRRQEKIEKELDQVRSALGIAAKQGAS